MEQDINKAPDDDAIAACKVLGKALVQSIQFSINQKISPKGSKKLSTRRKIRWVLIAAYKEG